MDDYLSEEDKVFLESVTNYFTKEDLITKEELLILLDSVQNTDIAKMCEINDYINHHYFFGSVEKWFEFVNISANRGNYYSMEALAKFYKNEEFPHESDSEYLLWLKKIVENDLARDYIKAQEQDLPFDLLDLESNVLFGSLIGSVSYELGLYYSSSEKLDELKKAQAYLGDALSCKYPSYPGPYVVVNILAELDQRIKQIEKYLNNQRIEQDQIELFKNLSIDKLYVDEQIDLLLRRLKDTIGEEIWDRFEHQTKSCLLTAVSCFYYLIHSTEPLGDELELDFSCVIIPLMKCLEYELKTRFYYKYLDYLKEKSYTVEQFVDMNRINTRNKSKLRGGILFEKDTLLLFNDYNEHPNDFTLGSFIFTTGIRNVSRIIKPGQRYVDRTMLDYCRDRLFRHNESELEIDTWLYNFTVRMKDIPEERNLSAHGGSVKSAYSASQALDMLILTKHILIDLILQCN